MIQKGIKKVNKHDRQSHFLEIPAISILRIILISISIITKMLNDLLKNGSTDCQRGVGLGGWMKEGEEIKKNKLYMYTDI